MHALALALVAVTAGQPSGRPLVLVLDNPSVSQGKGLIESLQIQLANTGVVRSGPRLEPGSLESRVDRARELGAAQGAKLVVWLERRSAREHVLVVVNPERTSSEVDLFRIRARAGPDVARSLALKVSDVLDRIIRGKTIPDALRVRVHEPPKPRYARWAVGVDGREALSDGVPNRQLGVRLTLSRDVVLPSWWLMVSASVAADFGVLGEGLAGQIQTRELVGAVGVAWLARLGAVGLGPGLEARLRIVRGRGITEAGNVGSRVVAIPTFALLAHALIDVTRRVQLQFAVGGVLAARHRKFAVNRVPLVDLGRWSSELHVGLRVLFQ